MKHLRFQLLCVLFVALGLIGAAQAQTLGMRAGAARQRAVVSAALNYSKLQPGQQCVLAIVLDIAPGFHAQSHTPLDENLIKLDVKLDANPAIRALPAIFPPGEVHEYPALGKVSLYTGRTIVYVPIEVDRAVKAGPIELSGKIDYQICDDKACFAPESSPFQISTQVVPVGQALTSEHAELFSNFDPTVFAKPQAISGDAKLFGYDLTGDAYFLAFVGAFIVGMLFNVMPCVLPIVPLKIMGFYKASQEHRSKSLALGAVFSAGLIATFGVLALLVVVFRTLAWGQLFGNAWFSAGIVAILVILSLQTFGAFAVVLPRAVYNITPNGETYLGNFLFGILTAILSTPCTFGMFLALLVWASAQPATIGVSLIMTVGAGMAFPYLLLSAFPEAARNFPRTGYWAELVKQMMGFLLLATAVYFGRRFLPENLGDSGFWWMLFAVVAGSGVFLVVRTMQFTRQLLPLAIAICVALAIIGPALAVTLRLTYVPIHWVNYSPQALTAARASGKPVLVKFTALWCGNCQAIEATVFVDQRTVNAVKERGVTMFKADLTDKSAPGWALLRSLHPVGAIPFTAVYLPADLDPHKLAGIYTTDDLLDTFDPHRGVPSVSLIP